VTAGILSLDLGTITGWACALPGAEPAHGHIRLPHDRGDGAFFSAFRRFLLDHITVHAPRLIVYEAPLITAGMTSVQTVFRLFGLAAHTVEIANIREVRCERANNASVKKFVTDNGRAKKPEVMNAIRARGWFPDDENEADALAVMLWAESKWAPRVTRAAGPLFIDAPARVG
jgi:Holliday junction resolvasome RuvABC endonuclease subunit